MTELQIKTQKKLMKMQKEKKVQSPMKPIEAPSPTRKTIIDCLTVDLSKHVAFF